MKTFFEHAFRQLLVLLVSVSVAFAQTQAPAPRHAAATQQELDQMLAPIALYPDSLLSQIFMASTYPLEVVEAARCRGRIPASRERRRSTRSSRGTGTRASSRSPRSRRSLR